MGKFRVVRCAKTHRWIKVERRRFLFFWEYVNTVDWPKVDGRIHYADYEGATPQ